MPRCFRLLSRRHLLSRTALLYVSAGILFFFLAISLTPITSPLLPPYTGRYEVGILDLETEVTVGKRRRNRVVHEAVVKGTGERAFELSTLALTLYYPSSLPSLPAQPWARPWLPQPISLIGTGYARLLHIYSPPLQSLVTFLLWVFGSKTVIPGVVDAPILMGRNGTAGIGGFGKVMGTSLGRAREGVVELRDVVQHGGVEKEMREEERTLPCVVFSHGMAGMSQSYSHYLGSIASHGYIVAAIEHRDGSGPGTIVHYPDGGKRYVWHLQLQDLESEPPMNLSDLKAAQLAFREAEIEETIRLFSRLNAGHGDLIQNLKPNSPGEALAGFKGRLNMSAITVAGHSYGATGALQALKNAPSEEMPVNGAIVLDPGKGSGPLNKDVDVPTLVMDSGEWTEKQVEFYGQGWHFDVVRKLVEQTKKGWFMTLTGSAHPSCTDAPLIVPWIMKLATGTTLNGKVALEEYISASVRFLEFLRDGKRKELLRSNVTSPDGPLGDANKRKKTRGKHGADWEVHVVPESVVGREISAK